MAEQFVLTTPATLSSYSVRSLLLDWGRSAIKIDLATNNGEVLTFSYSGQEATDLMIALNKANLTISSLHKRILTQLVTDGKLSAGSVTGTPD